MAQQDFYGTAHSLTQQKTIIRDLQVASATHATISTSNTARVPTTTAPTTTGSQIVWQTEGMTLMKIIPFQTVSTGGNLYTGLSARMVGWNIVAEGNTRLYVPHLIADFTITPSAAATFSLTTPSTAATSFTQTQALGVNYGDAKVFNADSTSGLETPAFALVDTVGCALVSLIFRSATASGTNYANAFWSSL